jgi:hypothetical protein
MLRCPFLRMGVQIFSPVGRLHLPTVTLFLWGREWSSVFSLLVLSKCRYPSSFPSQSHFSDRFINCLKALCTFIWRFNISRFFSSELVISAIYVFHLLSHATAESTAWTIYVLIFSIAYLVFWPVSFPLFTDNLLKSSDAWCTPILRAHVFHVLSSQFYTHIIAHKMLFAHSLRHKPREIFWINYLADNVRNKDYSAQCGRKVSRFEWLCCLHIQGRRCSLITSVCHSSLYLKGASILYIYIYIVSTQPRDYNWGATWMKK